MRKKLRIHTNKMIIKTLKTKKKKSLISNFINNICLIYIIRGQKIIFFYINLALKINKISQKCQCFFKILIIIKKCFNKIK